MSFVYRNVATPKTVDERERSTKYLVYRRRPEKSNTIISDDGSDLRRNTFPRRRRRHCAILKRFLFFVLFLRNA